MTHPISPGAELRSRVENATLQVPGAPNALIGRMIEAGGFGAIYVSGAAVSAGVLALPDVGLMTLTEMVQQVRYLAAAVSIPLIVDADTGFGETVNVERTVRELEHAGAAAIQLEDQVLPKRCGHLSGKTLVSTEAMVTKVKAAAAARKDPATIILARTDARGVDGMEAAIERAQAYVEAGADWIFPEALASLEEFAAFADAIDAPLVANMTEFGKSPLLNHKEFEKLGYAAVLYPVTLLRVAMQAIEATLVTLSYDGTQEDLLDLMQTRADLYELLDYESFEARDREHFGGE